MYQNERTEKILNLIKSNGYVTVKYLVENLHYSKATINRDLNILAQSGKIKRTYGGAEMIGTDCAVTDLRRVMFMTVLRRCRARERLCSPPPGRDTGSHVPHRRQPPDE